MNFSQLRYAKAVAETGTFTLAAERCYVTQPTLSNGIAQLEQELGSRIFKRTTRTVALTPFGNHIMPFIDDILRANDALIREAQHFGDPAQATMRIGISPLINSGWLGSMLEKFKEQRPDVDIILHEQNMADLYHMLEKGLIDIVFGVADSHKPTWKAAFLYKESLYFLPRGANNHGENNTLPFDKISGETFVMVPNVCGLAKATRALFRSNRKKLNEYPGEALSYQILEQWASLGLGAAILPQSKLLPSDRKAFALADKNGKEIYLDFEAVWLTAADHTPHLQDYITFLQKYCAGL